MAEPPEQPEPDTATHTAPDDAAKYELGLDMAAEILAGLANGHVYTDPSGAVLPDLMSVLACMLEHRGVNIDTTAEVLRTTRAEQRAHIDAVIARSARGRA